MRRRRGSLLGMVARMMAAGKQMSRAINRIARLRLEGLPVPVVEPNCLYPKLVHGFIERAVVMAAAFRLRLREQARARAAERVAGAAAQGAASAPAPRQPSPASRRRRRKTPQTHVVIGHNLSREFGGQLYDLRVLSRPLRITAHDIAEGMRAIAGLSDAIVVAQICADLMRASAMLSPAEDAEQIRMLAQAALALCPADDVETMRALASRAGETPVLNLFDPDPPPPGSSAADAPDAPDAPEATGRGPPDS